MNKLAQMLGYGGLSPVDIGNALMRPAGSTQDINNQLSQIPVQRGGVFPLTTYADNSTRFDPEAGVVGALAKALTAPARAYKNGMTRDDMIDEGVNFASTFGPGAIGAAAAKARPGFYAYHGTPARLDAFDVSRAGSKSGVSAKGRGVYMTKGRDVAQGYGPNVYEARINAPRSEFMDWDMPLADQPQVARRLESIPEYNALMREAIDPDLGPPRGSDMLMPILQGRQWPSGTDMYGPEVTGVLREAGIPGITWTERGARNYSVFDPSTMSRPRRVR